MCKMSFLCFWRRMKCAAGGGRDGDWEAGCGLTVLNLRFYEVADGVAAFDWRHAGCLAEVAREVPGRLEPDVAGDVRNWTVR